MISTPILPRSTHERSCVLFPGLMALAWLLAPAPAHAIGSADKDGYSIEAIGNVRLLGAYLHYPDEEEFFPGGDDGLAGAVTRLIIEGDLGPYFDYETNLYMEFNRMPGIALGGAFATAGTFRSPYRTTYLSWDFWDSGSVTGQMGVDRLAFQFMYDRLTATLGRFPINHSVTYIFTPNDLFAPFSASAINKVYKPGVDALRMVVSTGMLSAVELDAVMGQGTDDEPSWGRTALMIRLNVIKWNFEWALMGGKVAERWIVGGSLQGELGPIGVRAEGHAGFPDRDGDGGLDGDRDIHGRVAGGINILIPWHNFSINLEYAFMSDGADDTFDYMGRAMRFFPDDQPYLANHYVGLGVSGEIIPILTFNTFGLFNAQDYSGLASVMLDLSVADEASFSAGMLIPWGEEPTADSGPPHHAPELRSEFGLMPVTVFLETRFYY